MRHCKYVVIVLLLFFAISCQSEKSLKVTESISEVIIDSLFSDTLNRYVQFRAYVPKNHRSGDSTQVVYLLHGHGGSDDDWFSAEEGHIQPLLDSLINANLIPEVFAVTMDAKNSWYVNSGENMESMYIKEFIPFIEKKFDLTVPEGSRILAGNSAGGYGSLRFGLLYPSLFRDVILLSPAAYYPSPPQLSSSRKIDVFKLDSTFNDSIWQSYSYGQIAENRPLSKLPKFYTSTGDDDKYGIFKVITELDLFFTNHNIDHEIIVTNGGHSWDVWQQNFAFDLVRILKK